MKQRYTFDVYRFFEDANESTVPILTYRLGTPLIPVADENPV